MFPCNTLWCAARGASSREAAGRTGWPECTCVVAVARPRTRVGEKPQTDDQPLIRKGRYRPCVGDDVAPVRLRLAVRRGELVASQGEHSVFVSLPRDTLQSARNRILAEMARAALACAFRPYVCPRVGTFLCSRELDPSATTMAGQHSVHYCVINTSFSARMNAFALAHGGEGPRDRSLALPLLVTHPQRWDAFEAFAKV